MARLILCLLLGACAFGAKPLVSAEPVRLYYFVNQTPYEVTAFKDGLPVLDTPSEDPLSDYEGPRHKAWWVEGDLPLESGAAAPLIDYRLKRVAAKYGEETDRRRYEALVEWDRFRKANGGLLEDVALRAYVVGWVVDGEMAVCSVSGRSKERGVVSVEPFEVDERLRSGMPFVWALGPGWQPLPAKPSGFEALYFDGIEPDWKALSQATDPLERSALHYAAASGLQAAAERLIEERQALVRKEDEAFLTALSYAAVTGRSAVAKLLLENRAELSDGWEDLSSIVRRAAAYGHYETLVAMAADKARGREGEWHYSWAASDALNGNYEDIAIHLLDRGASFSLLETRRNEFVFSKFAAGYPQLGFRLMEKLKIKPEKVTVNGMSLPHSVASYADGELLKRTVSLGLDIEAGKDSEVGTPMQLAIGSGNVDAICWMVEEGGVALKGKEVAQAYGRAIQSGQFASAECLIGYGLDVNEELAGGVTPLAFALMLREFEIARLLAEAGGVFHAGATDADLVLARILEADEPAFLDAAVGYDGFDSAELFEGIGFAELAGFYEAERVMAAVWGAAKPAAIPGTNEVEREPQLASPINLVYPSELQERYGSLETVVAVLIAASGQPVAVRCLEADFPAELRQVAEEALLGARFEPARQGGEAVPVVFKAKLPLRAQFNPDELFNVAEVDEKPRVLHWADPVYPYELQFRGVRGEALIAFVLLEDGTVRDAKPVEYSHEAFARAAVQSVQSSVWQPAKKNGRPVACRVRIPVRFSP